MAKWNAKMDISPEERGELRLEDLAAVLPEAKVLLASVEPLVWVEIARQFPDRAFTEKQKATLLYLYGLGVRRLDQALKRNLSILRHSLNRKIKPIIAYLRSLGVKDLDPGIDNYPPCYESTKVLPTRNSLFWAWRRVKEYYRDFCGVEEEGQTKQVYALMHS